MKKLYLTVTIILCVIIILFVWTFFYIDTNRHTSHLYNIYQNGEIRATASLDIYNTEDKLVYRSVTTTPFHSISDEHKRKLSVDKRGHKFDSYNKKHLSKGVSMDIYLKRVDSSINFLAVGHSNFAYAKRIPIDKDPIVFENNAVISYFNLIDKYGFRGSPQSFSALTHTYTFLPPYKSSIHIRQAKEEVIEVGQRKVKALLLKVKCPDKNEALLWVNRWTHVPLIIKIPRTGFEAVWTNELEDLSAKKRKFKDIDYETRDITFKSKDLQLAGTITIPKSDGPFPAVLLVWGPGPQDKDGLGMLAGLAHGLAKNGIATLRFDKRGVGESEGNFFRFSGEDTLNDLTSAIENLSQVSKIDKDRIAILGHSEGGYYAAALAKSNPLISACIIMSGLEIVNLPDTDLEMMWSFDKSADKWDKEYLEDIAKTSKDTADILMGGKDWAMLLQKRVFLKKRYLDMRKKPLDLLKGLKRPLLLLRGRKDTVISSEHIKLVEESLREVGNINYEIIEFNKLNHFFGKKLEDGIHRTSVSIDNEVIESISKWLKETIPPPEPEPVLEKSIEMTVEEETIPQGEEI